MAPFGSCTTATPTVIVFWFAHPTGPLGEVVIGRPLRKSNWYWKLCPPTAHTAPPAACAGTLVVTNTVPLMRRGSTRFTPSPGLSCTPENVGLKSMNQPSLVFQFIVTTGLLLMPRSVGEIWVKVRVTRLVSVRRLACTPVLYTLSLKAYRDCPQAGKPAPPSLRSGVPR